MNTKIAVLIFGKKHQIVYHLLLIIQMSNLTSKLYLACARDVDRLKEFGFTGRFPHCLPNGDYDELQCVVRDCFCRSHPEELFAMHALNTSKCCRFIYVHLKLNEMMNDEYN